jgi:hypothetical protein
MLDPEFINSERAWAQRVVNNAKAILLRNRKVATGALVQSVRYEVSPKGKISFFYAPEGKWVTQGRRAGSKFPPIQKISQWIKQKGITPRDPDTTEEQLAFLFARSIADNGIKPVRFMNEAIKLSKQQLKDELKQAQTKSVYRRLKRAAQANFRKI